MYEPEIVLFLAAHPDDELNVAGTLNKFKLQGAKIHYAVFTACEEDSKELGFYPLDLLNEMRESLGVIGVDYVHTKEYRARYLRYQTIDS